MVALEQEDAVRVPRGEGEQVKGVGDRPLPAVLGGAVDVVAETDHQPGDPAREEPLFHFQGRPPVAVRVAEDDRLAKAAAGSFTNIGRTGTVRSRMSKSSSAAAGSKARISSGDGTQPVSSHRLPHASVSGNAGGRSFRRPAEPTGRPFEPAYALGNRVLSPASLAPPTPVDGLAELEHPRTGRM